MKRWIPVLGAISVGLAAVGGCDNQTSSPVGKAPTGKTGTAAATGMTSRPAPTGRVPDMPSSVTGALAEQQKASFQKYIAGVKQAGEAMRQITSADTAKAHTEELKQALADLSAHGAAIKAMAAADMAKLKAEYQSQLDAAVKVFREQVERLSKDPALESVSSMVKSIELIG